MSRASNPGCMLRVTAALFGAIFLPVGISFFFVLQHRFWLSGVGAVACALGFFYVAWRADDLLGFGEIRDTRDMEMDSLPPLDPPAPSQHHSPPPPPPQDPDQSP